MNRLSRSKWRYETPLHIRPHTMNAISGTRRTMKELVDGTIRVQIDIDPAHRADFLRLFPSIDMPVALAPLVADFERKPEEKPEQLKGGEISKWIGMRCKEPDFWEFLGGEFCTVVQDESGAADVVRKICNVEKRRHLDHDNGAAQLFHEKLRKPYLEWKA